MRFSPVLPLLFVMAASLAACAHNFDGVARLNRVPFGGTNEANLAAMVANPADLIHGHGQTAVDGLTVASPIQRLQADRPKALLKPGQTGSGAAASGG